MKITNVVNSDQIKSELLHIARGVIKKTVKPEIAGSAVGTYRAVFQLIKLELKEKELGAAATRAAKKRVRK